LKKVYIFKIAFIFAIVILLLRIEVILGQLPGSQNQFTPHIVLAQNIYFPSSLKISPFLTSPQIPSHFKFTHLTSKEGLPRAQVLTMLQDHQGFMWFGTMSGLVRYDGYDFKTYLHNVKDQRSLNNNYIRALYEDHTGILWVGTSGGLDQFDRDTENFVHYQHDSKDDSSLSNDLVLSLFEDKAGELWVGTKDGVSRLNQQTGKFVNYKSNPNDPHSLGGNNVYTLTETLGNGELWLGTLDGGASVLNVITGVFTRYQNNPDIPTSLSSNTVYDIYQDRAGSLWFSTANGLDRFDPSSQTFTHYQHDPQNPNTVADNFVRKVYEDRTGRFWVSTHSGLDLFDRKTGVFTHIRHDPNDPNSFSEDSAWYIYEDNTGGVWFSTVSNGINRLPGEPEKFTIYRNYPQNLNSLSANQVRVMLVDRTGNLWLGTVQGLNRFDGQIFTRFLSDSKDPTSLSDNGITAIAQDTQNNIWIGTDVGGLNRFDGKGFTHYLSDPKDPFSLGDNGTPITFLYPDQHSGLWIGLGTSGLDYFDGQHFTHYQPNAADPESIPTHYIFKAIEDQQGGLWFPSEDKGLIRFDLKAKTFSPYLIDPTRPDNEINKNFTALYITPDGAFWIAGGSGLIHFDPVSDRLIQQYTINDGLPSETVESIQADDQGYLWLSTAAGLSKFNPATGAFRNYDEADGLANNLFIEHASAQAADGELFFGSYDGVVAFHPDQLKDNPHIPPVVLTGFELFNVPVKIGEVNSPLPKAIETLQEITLRYDQSDFTFNFAALGYSSPQKLQYAYKMEGFDDNWRTTTADRRFATYTNLDPGSYVFRVKASNNDGIWNDQGTALKVIIIPPWWGTWWFRSLFGLGIFGLVLVAFRWRVQSFRERNKELEREVAERVKDLTESNRLLEIANRKTEAANQDLEAFVYSVSHDLRAPLRTIDGFSKILQEDNQSLLDAASIGYISRIHHATKKMEQLIDDLLKLSRVTRSEMSLTEVDLSTMARETLIDLQATQPDRQVEIILPETLLVNGDENLLRIVLTNLLNNAWKFTGKCQNARIEIGTLEQNGKSIYFVKDNGAGFDMNYANKLFGAFQRLHSSSDFEGTGIGLTIVQRIIYRHGGDIWAEGIVDQGATFYFTLSKVIEFE
jgi:ligand-binding sensor domain-containing protein/signal transduction histidine kinase